MINVETVYTLKREQTKLRTEIRSLISKRAFIDKAIDNKQSEYRDMAWQIQKLEMNKKQPKRKFHHDGKSYDVKD